MSLPASNSTGARRFSIRDIMIAVGALAVIFSLVRLQAQVDRSLNLSSPQTTSAESVLAAASLVLVGLSLSALVSSLLQPRAPLRRLVRQPGFLACLAVASNVVAQIVQRVGPLVNGRPMSSKQWGTWAHNFLYSLWVPFFVGHAVALALFIGWLGGFHLGKADWAERIGRLLGGVWLGYWIVNAFGFFRG